MSTFSDVTREIHKFKIEGKFFKARVVNNNDPKMNQRVQIFIDELHRGHTVSDLPWAIKMGPAGEGSLGGAPGEGSISIPTIGSSVIVIMQDNSDEYPIYLGSSFFGDTQLSELLEAGTYPFTYGFIDHANNIFYVDTLDKHVYFNTAAGTVFHIFPSGAVSIITASTMNLSINGDTQIYTSGQTKIASTGNMEVESGGTLTLSAPNIIAKGNFSHTATADTPPSPNPPIPRT